MFPFNITDRNTWKRSFSTVQEVIPDNDFNNILHSILKPDLHQSYRNLVQDFASKTFNFEKLFVTGQYKVILLKSWFFFLILFSFFWLLPQNFALFSAQTLFKSSLSASSLTELSDCFILLLFLFWLILFTQMAKIVQYTVGKIL